MVFLNLILMGGLAAVSAPIVIHLLHRARIVPRDWAAMMFLDELFAAQSRSLKIRDWLLLAVRAGTIACVVLAMMQPVFTTAALGSRPPDASTSAIVLLDDSASMSAGQARTAWQDAQELALRYIDTLRSGDDVTILRVTDAAKGFEAAAMYDLDRARERVRELTPHPAPGDVPQALTAALQVLNARHGVRQEIVFFTDLQASGWHAQDGPRWMQVHNALQAARIRPTLLTVATPDLHPENVAVLDVVPSRAIIDPGTPVSFQFTLANEGGIQRDATVSFLVNGVVKSTRSVPLLPNGRETLSFEHTFDRAGSHSVGCRVRAAGDALPFDNELFHSVLVMERLPVLLVDGDRRANALASETGFLRMALEPEDRDDANWHAVVSTTTIEASELRYDDLSKYRVAILANVAALPAATVSDLERFVVAGGGLFIALGDRVRPEVYNRDLFRAGAGLLPLALDKWEGERPVPIGGAREGPASSAVRLGGIVTQTHALDLFRPERGQDWSRARIRSYFSTAAPTEGVRVLATFDNGQTAFAQKQLGEGKVILYSSALDAEWSDLPVHPFFVPLMQNIVFELASAIIPPRNAGVGQTLYYVGQNDSANRPYTVQLPDGSVQPLKPQRQGALAIYPFDATAQPGVYSIGVENSAPNDRVYYAVAAERSESILARLAPADVSRVETESGLKVAQNWNDLAGYLNLQAGGVPLASIFVALAIVLCLTEIILLRRWA